MENLEEFSVQIKRARKAAHMTQKELATALGVDRTLINHWEKGRRKPSFPLVVKVASVLRGEFTLGSVEKDIDLAPTISQQIGNALKVSPFGDSLTALARIMGYEEKRWASIEQGTRAPTLTELFAIAEGLGVAVDYLLGRTDNPHLPAKGGEEVDPTWEKRLAELEDQLRRLQGTVATLETVVRSQLPITPAEWNRIASSVGRNPKE